MLIVDKPLSSFIYEVGAKIIKKIEKNKTFESLGVAFLAFMII